MKYIYPSYKLLNAGGIYAHRIQIMCGEGHIPGDIRIGSVWGIPDDAEKPADVRIKNGKYIKKLTGDEKRETSHKRERVHLPFLFIKYLQNTQRIP